MAGNRFGERICAEGPRKGCGSSAEGDGSFWRPRVHASSSYTHYIFSVSGRVRRWNRVFPRKARGRNAESAEHAAEGRGRVRGRVIMSIDSC